MSVSVFDSKMVQPNDQMLAAELGPTYNFLEAIRLYITQNYGDVTPEWKFYGQKSGWILKLLSKKRNVLFLIPFRGYFRVAFTFGDKATDKVLDSSVPDFIKHELFVAKKYAEGRTIHLEVNNEEQCSYVLELISIKME